MNSILSKDKLPKELNEIGELPKFIQEFDIKLYSKQEYTKEDIINAFIEGNQPEEAFFIIDLGKLKDQFLLWKRLFPKIKPYYAVKCCPNPLVLRMLGILGCGFDCASKEEIINVNEVDIDSSRIIYANTVKDPSFIKFARSRDVDVLTFDDENELYKIKLFHPYAKLVLRIKTDDSKAGCTNVKFGCYLKEAVELLKKAKFLSLDVIGVSFHAESQCKDMSSFIKAIKDSREVFRLAKELYEMDMYLLDIGGGFPGCEIEGVLPIEEIAKTINSSIDEHFSDVKNLEIISEPGRFFVTQSHTLIVNVIGKRKEIEDGEVKFIYYINEGVYGSFNSIRFDGNRPKLTPFNLQKREKAYKSRVYGPLMDDVDILMPEVELPELTVGEWCYFENFGAYTTASASDYIGFSPTKSVYLLSY